MTEWNLWHSIDFLLLLQRVHCVSPFYLDRHRNELKVSAFTRFYLWSVLITFLVALYVLLFRWNCFATILTFLPPGYLWTILTSYDIFYINAQFILNVIFVDAGKWQQMEFLHRINGIDRRLGDTFGMCVDFRQYRQRILRVAIVFILYYYGVTIGLCVWAHCYGNDRLLVFVFVYQFAQMSLASTAFASVNSTFLIRDRFRLLTTLYQHTDRDFGHKFPAIDKRTFLMKIEMIFVVFKELCDLIKLLDEYSGWNNIFSLVQDFTLPLIRWYFTFYILWKDGLEGNGVYVGTVLLWSIGTLAKSGLSAVAINMTLISSIQISFTFDIRKGGEMQTSVQISGQKSLR